VERWSIGQRTPSLHSLTLLREQFAPALVKVVSGQNRPDISSRGWKIDALLETMRSNWMAIRFLKRCANPAVNPAFAGIVFRECKWHGIAGDVPSLDRLAQIP